MPPGHRDFVRQAIPKSQKWYHQNGNDIDDSSLSQSQYIEGDLYVASIFKHQFRLYSSLCSCVRAVGWRVRHRPLSSSSSSFSSTSSLLDWRHEPVFYSEEYFFFYFASAFAIVCHELVWCAPLHHFNSQYVRECGYARVENVWKSIEHLALCEHVVCMSVCCSVYRIHSCCYVVDYVQWNERKHFRRDSMYAQHTTCHTKHNIYLWNVILCLMHIAYYTLCLCLWCAVEQGRTECVECVKRKWLLTALQKECLNALHCHRHCCCCCCISSGFIY